MDQNSLGIPLLKFPGIKNAWARRIVQVPGWERFVMILRTILNVENIGIHPNDKGVDLCVKLLDEITEIATLTQFLRALHELEPFSIVNDIKDDINAYYAVLQQVNQPASDACYFFLFTPACDPSQFIEQMGTSASLVPQTIHLADVEVTRLSREDQSHNTRLSIVIARLLTEEATELFINFIGFIHNLVIVHQELTNIGCTQLCIIDENPMIEEIVETVIQSHNTCGSRVQRVLPTSLGISATMICSQLAKICNNRTIIILDDQQSQSHLFCLCGSLIWSIQPIFPVAGTSLLHLSFANKKEILEMNDILRKLVNQTYIISVDNHSEVLTAVSTYGFCNALFSIDFIRERLQRSLLTLTAVKSLQPGNLERLMPIVSPRDRERLQIIKGMLTVTIEAADLPVPTGIVPVNNNYFDNDEMITQFVGEPLDQPLLAPIDEIVPDMPIWLAKGSSVYARDLQHQPDKFLRSILAQQTVLVNGHTLIGRTRYWIATQSVLPVRLYRANGQLKLWSKELHIDDHQVFQMNFSSQGHYRIVVGDEQNYDLTVSPQLQTPPTPNQNNNNPVIVAPAIPVIDHVLILVPDANLMLQANNCLIALGFAVPYISNNRSQVYERQNQRVILLTYAPDELVLLTDLLKDFARRVVLFEYQPGLYNVHSPEMYILQLVHQQVDLIRRIKPIICTSVEANANMQIILNAYFSN